MRYSMIHFYNELVARTVETIKEACDCTEILNDLKRIDQAITNINLRGNLSAADQLDRELRHKYSCINNMIEFANSIPISEPRLKKNYSASEAALSNLEQDYYGILCDTGRWFIVSKNLSKMWIKKSVRKIGGTKGYTKMKKNR